MFVGANLRFFWDKGWGAEIKAKTKGENVALFCSLFVVSFWWLHSFGMISGWFRNDIGMSNPKKMGVFLYRKFRHGEMENKMGAMFKIFMSNAKVFCFLMKGHFFCIWKVTQKMTFFDCVRHWEWGCLYVFWVKVTRSFGHFWKKRWVEGAPCGVVVRVNQAWEEEISPLTGKPI